MAKALGDTVKAYVKVSSTYTWLGGESSNSINRTAEAVECSDKDSAWAEFLAGKRGATVEITVFADAADSAQTSALTSFAAGSEVDWAIGTISSSTISAGDYGKGIITAVSDTNDYGAVRTRTISITATGEVTHV